MPSDDPSADVDITQWQWSFPVAESILMRSFHDSCSACYYVITLLAKSGWSFPCSPQPRAFLADYFLNACMWVFENTPSQGTNVMNLCRKVIDWLLSCYEKTFMPHYMIRDHNLIGQFPRCQLEQVINWLTMIRRDLSVLALIALKLDSEPELGHMWLERAPNFVYDSEQIHIRRQRGQILQAISTELSTIQPSVDKALVTLVKHLAIHPVLSHAHPMHFSSLIKALEIDLSAKTPEFNKQINDLVEKFTMVLSHLLNECGKTGKVAENVIHLIGGEIYYSIWTRISKMLNVESEKVGELAEKHYLQVGTMYLPGEWSDKGVLRDISLAKHYFESGHIEKLQKQLNQIQPVLRRALEVPETLDTLMDIPVNRDLHRALEERGFIRQKSELDTSAPLCHPVCVGLYLTEQLALREKDVGISEEAGNNLTAVKKHMVRK